MATFGADASRWNLQSCKDTVSRVHPPPRSPPGCHPAPGRTARQVPRAVRDGRAMNFRRPEIIREFQAPRSHKDLQAPGNATVENERLGKGDPNMKTRDAIATPKRRRALHEHRRANDR